jgi:pimeloyl-ACP methyl ester carboxylesterase|nr:alpha/beta fold hydrolase [Kofleriaceae bacterium]
MDHIDANGLRFAYLAEGAADAPLVLMLHGFPDTAYTWDRVLPAVAAAGYRAVAPFTRGYHPTAIPADGAYDSDTLGRDALALIDALSPGKPAVLVGHDWGASAAYSAAAQGPSKLRLLITMAIPHPARIRFTPRLAWTLRHFVTLRGRNAAAKLARDDFALVDTLVRRWSPAWPDMPASETAHVKESLRHAGSAEAACGYYRAQSLRGVTGALRQKIAVPSVAFAGEHDNIEPRAYEKARHQFTASYEVVQVPGGHFMHREQPEHFVTELVRVLRDKAPA